MAQKQPADKMVLLAPICVVLGVSTMMDIPELGLLLGAALAALPPAHQERASRWWHRVASRKEITTIVAAVRSKHPAYIFGGCVSIALALGNVQVLSVIATAGAYLAFTEINKAHGRRMPIKEGKLAKQKITPVVSARPFPSRKPAKQHEPDMVRSESACVPKTKPGGSCPEALGPLCPDRAIDTEIQELVAKCTPTRQEEFSVRKLSSMAKKCINRLVPEVEVTCVPQGNFELIAAAGERPEINMVVTCDRSILAERLKQYFLNGQTRVKKSLESLAPDQLQKTATRTLRERLNFVKFWRSQFSGPEPMVVLLVPPDIGLFHSALRLNFTVNMYPILRLKTIMATDNTSVKELMMLVTTWARVRALTNISRGLLHPYAWGLLVKSFIRFRQQDGQAHRVCRLFEEFLGFCLQSFSSRSVTVCYHGGVPEQASEAKPLCTPYIPDPFDATADLGETLNAYGVQRVLEEVDRARSILSQADLGRLSKLLERWMPPSDEAPNPECEGAAQ